MRRPKPERESWKGERILVLSPTPSHPQDFGNRKRIFEVCKRITDGGGRISFAHYPAEAEWRTTSPWNAERAMAETWAQYFTIPPTRDLHCAPRGMHHEIDEWWDESIGDFLRWAFRTHSFDAFIVNYAWLSKAFEYAPDYVVKLLDTHDKVSGRRELLVANGLEPEFFFTRPEEEARALSRADLVWAIKHEEQAEFERLCDTPVMTLPHLDPLLPIKRPARDPEGYLRVGFLGARNSINRASVLGFLEEALPIFAKWFAPIKFILAGSVCDELERVESPFVELRGRVRDVASFYGSVDLIAVPMTFSTGLKIKTGEALSLGMPLVTTAHAFEGYESDHPLHALSDFKAMAEALVELSFAPQEALDELAAASVRAHDRTAKRIDETFFKSRELIRERQHTIVLAVDARAVIQDGIFNAVLRSGQEYMRFLSNLVVLIVKGSAADLVAAAPALEQIPRIVVADDLPDVPANRSALSELNVDCVNVEAFLTEKGAKILVADALHGAFDAPCCRNMVIIARTDMIALSEGRADFELPLNASERAFVVSHSISRETATWKAKGASQIRAPLFYRMPERRPMPIRPKPHILVLGSIRTEAVLLALAMAEAWKIEARLVHGFDEQPNRNLRGLKVASVGPLEFLTGIVDGREPRPLFALDLSAGRVGLQLCREVLERLKVPLFMSSATRARPTITTRGLPGAIATEADLARLFSAVMLDPSLVQHWAQDSTSPTQYDKDAGWAYIWAFCKRVGENGDLALA